MNMNEIFTDTATAIRKKLHNGKMLPKDFGKNIDLIEGAPTDYNCFQYFDDYKTELLSVKAKVGDRAYKYINTESSLDISGSEVTIKGLTFRSTVDITDIYDNVISQTITLTGRNGLNLKITPRDTYFDVTLSVGDMSTNVMYDLRTTSDGKKTLSKGMEYNMTCVKSGGFQDTFTISDLTDSQKQLLAGMISCVESSLEICEYMEKQKMYLDKGIYISKLVPEIPADNDGGSKVQRDYTFSNGMVISEVGDTSTGITITVNGELHTRLEHKNRKWVLTEGTLDEIIVDSETTVAEGPFLAFEGAPFFKKIV